MVGSGKRGFHHAARGSKEEFHHKIWKLGGISHAGGEVVRRELLELWRDIANQAQIRGRCLEPNWTVTRNADFCFSEGHTEKSPMDSTMIQWTQNMFSWMITWRLRTTYLRSWRRELMQKDGDSETHKSTFQRGWRLLCAASLRTNKDMGNFWAWL